MNRPIIKRPPAMLNFGFNKRGVLVFSAPRDPECEFVDWTKKRKDHIPKKASFGDPDNE